MRAITLMLVLALATILAMPVLADTYAPSSPSSETPSMEPAPAEAPPSEVPPAPAAEVPSSTTMTTTTTATAGTMAMMSPEVDAYNRQFAKQYFGISDADISALRAQGLSWGEIYLSANLALRTNQPVSQIASLRRQGLSWSEIGGRYNVAMVDLTTPFIPAGRVAGVTAEAGPMGRPMPIYDRNGQVVLMEQDARFFEKMGYTWRDIAVAANISRRTGVPVSDLLRVSDSGKLWSQIARDHGLNPSDVMDVSNYPFRAPLGTRREKMKQKEMQRYNKWNY